MRITLGLLVFVVTSLSAQQKIGCDDCQSSLLLVADTDCTMTVDGQDLGKIVANETKLIKVNIGEHLVVARSEDGTRSEKIVSVEKGAQAVVKFAPLAARNSRAEQPHGTDAIDLNGQWVSDSGYPKTELINISHSGSVMVATKITGDENVPAGQITFRGSYTENPFAAEVRCADTGFVNPWWERGKVTIIDKDHLNISHCSGAAVSIHRILEAK